MSPVTTVPGASTWSALTGGPGFSYEFENQRGTVPVDGSDKTARTYSPFVIRMLLPSILNASEDSTLYAGARARSRPDYGAAVRGAAAAAPSNYAALSGLGGALPGLMETSVRALETNYNRARYDQLNNGRVGAAASRGRSTPPTPRPPVPARAGELEALSLALQLKRISELPPLLLLINPTTMSVRYGKVAAHQERTRMGYVYQAWGEELVKVSLSFRIGAYFAGAAAGSSRSPGMSGASRSESAAFQQLQTLLGFYQSGGYLLPSDGSRAYAMVGNLALEYDQKVWVGHMDSFSFGEEETTVHGGVTVEVEFTAVREYDTASVPGAITSLTNPNGDAGSARRMFTGARGGGVSFGSAPTIGFSSREAPAQPWAAAPSSSPTEPPAAMTRRR